MFSSEKVVRADKLFGAQSLEGKLPDNIISIMEATNRQNNQTIISKESELSINLIPLKSASPNAFFFFFFFLQILKNNQEHVWF